MALTRVYRHLPLRSYSLQTLEQDLDGDETQILPDLLAKLLFAFTYNRQIKCVVSTLSLPYIQLTPSRDNVFENLRKTYLRRAPERNLLGTIEEPIEWATLGLSQKVRAPQ